MSGAWAADFIGEGMDRAIFIYRTIHVYTLKPHEISICLKKIQDGEIALPSNVTSEKVMKVAKYVNENNSIHELVTLHPCCFGYNPDNDGELQFTLESIKSFCLKYFQN